MSLSATGCGSVDSPRGGVTIEALTSTTVSRGAIGGKPAAPPATATTQPAGDLTSASVQTPAPDATGAPLDDAPAATETPSASLASDGSTAPGEGRWIDVDVTNFRVRLMDGASVVREIAPVGVGVEIDTGNYASTQTGLFHVYNKVEDLVYDPPYNTYISHWVGFDPDKANGFHSLLKDASGNVVDPGTGRISNGCIRTGAPDAIFAFAEEGMAVWVHH